MQKGPINDVKSKEIGFITVHLWDSDMKPVRTWTNSPRRVPLCTRTDTPAAAHKPPLTDSLLLGRAETIFLHQSRSSNHCFFPSRFTNRQLLPPQPRNKIVA